MKNDTKLNLSIMFISFVIAFIMWVSVTNMKDPMINGFVSMPVDIENESIVADQSKTYNVVGQRVCRINYRANQSKINQVRREDFKAYIDFKDITGDIGDEATLDIRFKALKDVDDFVGNIDVEPKTLRVRFSNVTRGEYKVRYSTKGNMDEGHTIGNVIFSPNVVYVSGTEEKLSKISHISIDVPVNNQDETFSGVAKAKVISSDGEVMSMDGLTLNVDEINYSVVVHISKSVTVNAITEGVVKKGYAYAGTEVYPNTIMISGPRSVVESIYTIDLPAIDINGLSESKEVSYPISSILPIGINSSTTGDIVAKVMVNDNVLNNNDTTDEIVGPHIEPDENGNDVVAESESSAEN